MKSVYRYLPLQPNRTTNQYTVAQGLDAPQKTVYEDTSSATVGHFPLKPGMHQLYIAQTNQTTELVTS